jgi:hypothetical protein
MNNKTLKDNLKTLEGRTVMIGVDKLTVLYDTSQPFLRWDMPEQEKNFLLGRQEGIALLLNLILQE